jgi:hypothetical protein
MATGRKFLKAGDKNNGVRQDRVKNLKAGKSKLNLDFG